VWEELHHQILVKLNARGQVDWKVGAVDGSHVRAVLFGGS